MATDEAFLDASQPDYAKTAVHSLLMFKSRKMDSWFEDLPLEDK